MRRIRTAQALESLQRRARIVPVASTIAASGLAILPVVTAFPIAPPTGLLMLLSWRLIRPELWPAWAALPLGLADDLFTGNPLGTAPVLWTTCLLIIDQIDRRMIWRDYWQEWLIGLLLVGGCLVDSAAIASVTGGSIRIDHLWPVYALSVALLPAFAHVAAALDRWRLGW